MDDNSLLFIAVFVWLGFISLLVFQHRRLLKQVLPKGGEKDIRNKFKELLAELEIFKQQDEKINQKLDQFKKESINFIQKMAILRYNPYNDTGGEQSFSIAFLDGNLNGFILTSLHSRAGTRVYAKIVTKGKSDVDLSSEEKDVLKKAVDS